MSRAIDADALIKYCDDKWIPLNVDAVNAQPTIEPEYKEIDFVQQHKKLPVNLQLERKKGQWIKHVDDLFPTESTIECNACHHEQPLTIDDNYCPNCGIKMINGDGVL